MKNLIIAAASGALLLISGQGMTADLEAGKKKAAEVCAACHGPDGTVRLLPFPSWLGSMRVTWRKA